MDSDTKAKLIGYPIGVACGLAVSFLIFVSLALVDNLMYFIIHGQTMYTGRGFFTSEYLEFVVVGVLGIWGVFALIFKDLICTAVKEVLNGKC